MNKNKQIPLDKIMKALGDPVRLSVVQQLLKVCDNGKTCGSFEHCVQKATFSHHIKILKEAKIVCERHEGVRKYLSVHPDFKQDYPHILQTIQESP